MVVKNSFNFDVMKKYLWILLIPVGIGMVLTIRKCEKPEEPKTVSSKILEQQIRKQDSLYKKLKLENEKTIDSLNKVIKTKDLYYSKRIKEINKKYAEELNIIINTPIDSTILISRRYLSEEIDYTKFLKK